MVKNTPEYMRNYYNTHKEKYLINVFCDVCQKDIKKSYYNKHCESKAHNNNKSLNIENINDIEKRKAEILEQINKLNIEYKFIMNK